MALRDFVVIAHTPVNYTSSGERVRDHIVGIDTALGGVLPGGRPGDEGIKAPTVADLVAAGLDDALAYWTLDFDDASQIPESDADYTLISNTTPSSSYVPFGVVNARASLPAPLGAMMCHDASKAFTTAKIAALALDGDMTMLCMGMDYLQNSSNRYTICDYGNQASAAVTGTSRLPFSYELKGKAGVGSSAFPDRVLTYTHVTAAEATVSVSPDLDAAAQGGDGMGISLPGAIEFGHGFSRSVGATTDVNFYVNGLKVHTETGLVNPGVPGTAATMRLHIGVGHANTQSYGGTIRSFGLWGRVLSDAEIDAFYKLCIGRS